MIQIDDNEILKIERLLLPENCHFPEDARAVIRCWESRDVAACPGSGKTTVLLAKLKLLADRLPLENGAGICVLSHTNVAVNEIKKKMVDDTGKLMGYPNYAGTIQSFVDKFVTIPYLKRSYGITVQPVDNRTYAEHLYQVISSGQYSRLRSFLQMRLGRDSGQYSEIVDYLETLFLDSDGNLKQARVTKPLAGAKSPSAVLFKEALDAILKTEGLIKYTDTYMHAKAAVEDLTDEYANLFSRRFQYVFIDEYQDCTKEQREALNRLFDREKCCVFHFGDSDQAIYSSIKDANVDWIPQGQFLTLDQSNRFGQEIADVLCKMRTGDQRIVASARETGHKPVLIVYDAETISEVLPQFIRQLDRYGLTDPDGVYKAIGFIRNEDARGLKIGSYWDAFDGKRSPDCSFRFWKTIDEICEKLNAGQAYMAEPLVRRIVCRILHYCKITNPKTRKDYTVSTLKTMLDSEFFELYRDALMEMISLSEYERKIVSVIINKMVTDILASKGFSRNYADKFPPYFMCEVQASQTPENEHNVYVEPASGRRIQFDTVHGVKGETHDATLYLETEIQRSSDIARVLPWFGIGRPSGASQLYDYSRKIVYVGMSRPRKLLCLAIQGATYIKSENAFHDWNIVDLRTQDT